MTEENTHTSGSDSYRVLLVGCGQLGSRHLQALASLPDITRIEVLDSRPEALELGRERVRELSDAKPVTEIDWITSMEEASKDGDLCVIATQAKGRCELLRSVADTLGYTSFLLEKIVERSVPAIEEAIRFCHDRGISAWVNCQTRTVETYQRLKDKLPADEPIYLSAMGGLQFLATNGIHMADLFAYYDECSTIEVGNAKIDSVLHPSKRGAEQYDLTGTLNGYTDKGSSLTVSYGQSDCVWGHISVASSDYRCVVDHLQRWMIEADSKSAWRWRQVPFEGSLLVSETTKGIAHDILTKGDCDLPTLEESLVAHRFILNGLLPHFSDLLDRPLESCPVS